MRIYRCPRCRAEDISADAHPTRVIGNGTVRVVLVCRNCYRAAELEFRIACQTAELGYVPLETGTALTALAAVYRERLAGYDDPVFRTNFGTKQERVPIGSLQRIDAKRYPGAHSGVSAPFFVARGRTSTVKVNTKPYRLAAFVPLLGLLRRANTHVELDPFWD